MIKWESYVEKDGTKMRCKYFDKDGMQINDGDDIRYANGRVERVYATDDGTLGTDATNRKWIEDGRAVPCQYGIYPLEESETNEVEVIKNGRW